MGDKKKKAATVFVRLVSAAGTGFFYVKKKNPRKMLEKLEFRKYEGFSNENTIGVCFDGDYYNEYFAQATYVNVE